MSLREAISNPDSDFRKQMNEDWMDYVSSKVEDSPEAGEAGCNPADGLSGNRP